MNTPLRLRAENAEDVEALSVVLQDALIPVTEISWRRAKRNLLLPLLRHIKTGDGEGGQSKAALLFNGVLRVRMRGVPTSADGVLHLLAMEFLPGEGCAGEIRLHCTEEATIAVEVECIEAHLVDLPAPGDS